MSVVTEAFQVAFRDSGLSKQEFSKRSYLSINYLTTILKGTREPDKSDVVNICRVLGLDPAEYLDQLSPNGKKILPPVKKEVIYPDLRTATSGTKLQKAEGMCIYPGCFKMATENAHLNCHDQALFGAGTGVRVDHIFTAELCHGHHLYFHDLRKRKDLALSDEFKTCVLLTIKRKIQLGRIILK